MSGENEQQPESELDRAVSSRLARLRTMPVDISRLERALRGQMGRPRVLAFLWAKPMRAVAAVLLVAAAIAGILWIDSGGPALASADEMGRVHREMVAGRTPVMTADSIEDAGRMLSGQWPESPGLPRPPEAHVMACCMKNIKDRKVACVLLRSEGVPVTMTVAKAADMRSPRSPGVARGGATYHVHTTGLLNMVTTQRSGRWVCLIGEMPAERLIDIAARLEF